MQPLLFLAVPLVALAVSTPLQDPFTPAKWYALEALAVVWLLTERFVWRSPLLPDLGRRAGYLCSLLLLLTLAGALRHGLAWAVDPLVQRAACVVVALCAWAGFRRGGLRLEGLHVSVAVGSALVAGLGLLQMAGLRPLPWLAAGDQRSATFGNVNMASQFAGLSALLLLAGSQAAHPRRRFLSDLVVVVALAYVALAGTRSVLLALAAGALALASLGRLPLRRLAAATAGAGLLAAAIALAGRGVGPFDAAALAAKRTSAQMRLAVWADTLVLIRDRPLGVGAGNFEHAFTAYALAGRSRPREDLLYRSPHNEYLRLVAEEGWVGAALRVALLLMLAAAVRRGPRAMPGRDEALALLASGGAFLAIEACFQFPLDLAFPSLVTSLFVGVALVCADAPAIATLEKASRRRLAGDIACVAVAVALLAGTASAGAADYFSATGADSLPTLERACRLDPRRLDACVRVAWRLSVRGDHTRARSVLAAVLARSPSYYPALKLRAEDRLAAGEPLAGCREIEAYDALFAGSSSVRPDADACRRLPFNE